MPQNDRNRKRRRAYDQARDDRRGGQSTQRRSSAGAGSDLGYSGYAGYSSGGHPITNPNYDPDAPRPSRYTERTVNYGSYPDNSITFPTGGRSSQSGAQRPRSGQNGQRRTSGGNQRNRRPANGQNRNAQRRPQNAQNRSGQRMRPVQGQNARRDPIRREGRKKRKLTRAAIRRRRLMRRLTALVMLLCVIGAGVYLTVTMLFKISSIQVQTADGVVQEAGGYTSDQILQALDVHPEENIFSFDPGSKAAALEKVFPMLEDIRVERDYPGTVVVRVTEARPAWAMQTSSGWLTLSGGLKILEKDSAQPAGLPTLYGGEPVSAEPGEQLTFAAEPKADSTPDSAADSSASGTAEEEADQRLESLNTLLTALDAAGMSADVTRIEFADVDEMAFLYQDRISVWLGTLNELEYKLKLAKHVLLNEDGKGCAATDTGKLDFTHISMSSTRKFTFAQGEPELPSGYIVPEPVEETPAEEGVTGETADGTAPAEGDAAADAAAETPTDAAAAPAGPEAGQTVQPTPAEGTTPAAGDANQTQTTQ